MDTHVLLWWLQPDGRLASSALAMLNDPANILVLSTVSGFEISSKVAIGELKLPATPEVLIANVLQPGRVTELPLTLRHTYRVGQLPLIHRDPFDRLLVAVALEEGLTVVTADPEVRAYPVPTTW